MDSNTSAAVSLGEYVRIFRKRWFAACVGVLLGLSFGIAWYLLAPRQYEGNSVVAISPITDEVFSSGPVNQLINTTTETSILRSGEVAKRAAEIAGLQDDVRELQDRVSVGSPLNSQILEISFRAPSSQEAAAGANAFAQSYLEFRAATADRRLEAYVSSLRDQLDQIIADYDDAAEDSAARQMLEQRASSLQQEIGQASTLTVTPGQIITFAQEPTFPITPRLVVAVAAALVLAVILGVVVSGLVHALDDRVVTVGAAERLLGRRATGLLPPFHGRRRLSVVERDEIALSVSELRRLAGASEARSWLLMRADAGERTPADVLAWELPSKDPKLLIRHPRYPGFSAPAWAPLRYLESSGVEVVTAAGDEAAAIIASSDWPVFVDTCGAERFGDALELSSHVDAVVVCVELGRTREQDLLRSREALARSGITTSEAWLLVVRRTALPARVLQTVRDTFVRVVALAGRRGGAPVPDAAQDGRAPAPNAARDARTPAPSSPQANRAPSQESSRQDNRATAPVASRQASRTSAQSSPRANPAPAPNRARDAPAPAVSHATDSRAPAPNPARDAQAPARSRTADGRAPSQQSSRQASRAAAPVASRPASRAPGPNPAQTNRAPTASPAQANRAPAPNAARDTRAPTPSATADSRAPSQSSTRQASRAPAPRAGDRTVREPRAPDPGSSEQRPGMPTKLFTSKD